MIGSKNVTVFSQMRVKVKVIVVGAKVNVMVVGDCTLRRALM